MKVAVYRKEQFNAAHRLFNKDWDAAKNETVFGKCASPNYHGHNYDLVVKIIGEIDPETGYVIDLKLLSDIIQQQVINRFDHKNLNLDTIEFSTLIPTAENIVVTIYNLILPHIKTDLQLQVRLYETPKNFVEFPAF